MKPPGWAQTMASSTAVTVSPAAPRRVPGCSPGSESRACGRLPGDGQPGATPAASKRLGAFARRSARSSEGEEVASPAPRSGTAACKVQGRVCSFPFLVSWRICRFVVAQKLLQRTQVGILRNVCSTIYWGLALLASERDGMGQSAFFFFACLVKV